MFAKKFVITAATVATLAVPTVLTTAPAQADPGAAIAAGAAGLVGGLILGNALASPPPPPPPAYVVRRRPVTVYEDEVVVPRRCWREVWYDNWGDRHVRRLCR
jgi:hypothetical protein